ncbi:MAG TPA: acyl-CoA dehydrogenase family protein, partial [Chloroflexota bacterium]|nr:acyl-CoA dehydrogenase family protein [Chloroflexota bacterium]
MAKLLQSVKEIEAAREEVRKPSFMTQLFAGEPDFSRVLPFPEQNPEDRAVGDAFLARLATFLQQRVDAQEIERTGVIPRSVLDGLAELGAFGMTIPRAYGGIGLSQTNYDRVLTLVASHCNILALLLSVHQSIGVPRPILLFGTEEQKQAWLPRLAKGELSAFALTEPQIGSDPANMQT